MRFYFRAAARNLALTYQFVLLRVAVGLALALGLVATLVVGAWLFLTLDLAVAVPAILVLLLGLALVNALVGPYLLYLIEGGHVAVLTHVVLEREVPRNQLRFGLARVRENFASVTGLFVVDLAIRRVLRQLNAIINTAVSSLTAGLASGGREREAGVVHGVVGILQLALNITIGYVDKAVLANVYRRGEENNWASARDGVVLYAMTWRPVFAAALVLATLFYAPLIALAYVHEEVLAALGGAEAVQARLAGYLLGLSDVALVALAVVVLGGLTVLHYGLVKPGLTALVVTTYLEETAGEEPDDEWAGRLRDHAPEFRAFERRADGADDAEPKTGTWRDWFLP